MYKGSLNSRLFSSTKVAQRHVSMAINDMIGAKGWEQKTDYYKDLYDVILSPFALQMFTATRAQLASRILDVGCGTGLAAKMFSSSFMGPGKQYVGIDPHLACFPSLTRAFATHPWVGIPSSLTSELKTVTSWHQASSQWTAPTLVLSLVRPRQSICLSTMSLSMLFS